VTKKVWFCANCGYEVTSRGRCFQCRERLTASPLSELEVGDDDDDEVGYRLNDWDNKGRGRLIVALIRANIVHRFEDEELIVAADDEARVDDLLAELQAVLAAEGPDELAPGVDPGSGEPDSQPIGSRPIASGADGYEPDRSGLDGSEEERQGDEPVAADEMGRDEATSEAVEELYTAATRLHQDPTDMQADAEVAEASAGVFGSEDFSGMDAETWSAVGRVTRRLLGALGADEALEDEIRTQAGVLVKLLGPTVDPTSQPAGATGAVGAAGAAGAAGDRTRSLLAESTAALPEGRRDHGAATATPSGAGGDDAGHAGHAGDDGSDGDDGFEEANGADGADGEPVAGAGDHDGGEADEIVYELPDWLPDQRANLSLMLDAVGVSHTWDDGDLVVASAREAEVDGIFDRIESAEAVDGDDGEVQYHALEELFAAADRLTNDPESPTRRDAVIDASTAVDGPTPVGMADIQWWQLRAQVRDLADAIDTGAGADRVHEEAATVRDLLRAMV